MEVHSASGPDASPARGASAAPVASPESPESLSLRELFFVKKASSKAAEGGEKADDGAQEVKMAAPVGLEVSRESGVSDSAAYVDFRVSVSAPVGAPGMVVDGSGSAEGAAASVGAMAGGSVLNRAVSGTEPEVGDDETIRSAREEVKESTKVESSEGASDEEKQEDAAAVVCRLESQRKLVHSQVEELQRIVTLQCRLTASNPLAQELASAVLGTKGGKKTGNAPTTEALRYLHGFFSVKDTITKKEARDISVMSGATLTQVREFFAAQRSQVRARIQQCTDEAERRLVENADEQSQQFLVCDVASEKDIGFTKLTGVESVELLLELMRRETYFTQQEKLLQVILQTEPGLILRRFLEKGGLKVLHGWLIAAATDEQTSVLRQLLQVLSHLPMSNAIPLQMSSLLQPVNKLRFYFIPDVAYRARMLMAKWSKLFMNKAEGGRPKVSSVPAAVTKGSSDAARRGQKRERDAALVVKGYEEQRKKPRADALVKSLSEAARAAGKTPSAGEEVKPQSGVPRATLKKVLAGEVSKPKPQVAPRALVKPMIGEEFSKDKPSVPQRTSKKAVSGKEVLQQQEMKPRLSGKPVLDEVASNRTLSVLSQKPLSGPSPSSSLPAPQVPKARGASTAVEEASSATKVAGSNKGPVSNVRSSSNFQVSEAANAATAVSRKRSLADQAKERRKVLPVDDAGAGSRWRDPTARRPVVEVGKTSRPLSADEIRKAKLRARIMQLPTSGTTKSVHNPEPANSRGKPSQVGDGWSLERYTTPQVEDVGGKSLQVGDGASPFRHALSELDATPAPRQILDDETFDRLLLEQAAEAQVSRSEKSSNMKNSTPVSSLTTERETPTHVNDVTMRESSHDLGLDTMSMHSPTPQEENGPLSPSIAEALSLENMDSLFLKEDDNLVKDGHIVPDEILVPNTTADILVESVSLQIDDLAAQAAGSVVVKGIEADFVPWIVPPVVNLDPSWGVAAGDASKERGVQAARVKREEEEVYQDLLSIPADPKDLWDEEPVYDDTLTLEIPVEVPESAQSQKDSVPHVGSGGTDNDTQLPAQIIEEQQSASTNTPAVAKQQAEASNPGHDPNLLALLLNNPGLVSQLTSQQNMDSNLDGLAALVAMVKGASTGGQSLPSYAAGLGDIAQTKPGVPSYPTTGSHLSGQLQLPLMEQVPGSLQPQVPVADATNLEALPRPVTAPVPESNADQARGVYAKAGAVVAVPSWEPPQWALPPPPPQLQTGGLPPPPPPPQGHPLSQGNHLAPSPQGNTPLGAPANTGNWQEPGPPQKWPPAGANGWAPMTAANHAQSTAKQFDFPAGRGRPPPVGHNVDASNAALSVAPPPPYSQAAPQQNPAWPPPPPPPRGAPSHANHAPNNVHHTAPQPVNPPFTPSFRGNAGGWPHADPAHGFQPSQGRSFVADGGAPWGWPPGAAPPPLQPLPGPPPHLNNQHWQMHDFRPPQPPPPTHPHFRHDSRPPHPPQWHHPNAGGNRGGNW